ncbi:MAG: hypothetical protein P1V51_24835 [Deltaproteobacteria bacterium]|nr:hypothetical protein [Deltaproteobacteria bacterium]
MRTSWLLALFLLPSLACSGGQSRKFIDEEGPAPSELAAETTEIGYRSHDQILNSRRNPDDPVPLGGQVVVTIRRSTPGRAEFDAINVVVDDGGMIVLDVVGKRGEAPSICGDNSWCNELSYDIEKTVVGPIHVTVIDTRAGDRREADFEVAGG